MKQPPSHLSWQDVFWPTDVITVGTAFILRQLVKGI
jgi:hypothetical protein